MELKDIEVIAPKVEEYRENNYDQASPAKIVIFGESGR